MRSRTAAPVSSSSSRATCNDIVDGHMGKRKIITRINTLPRFRLESMMIDNRYLLTRRYHWFSALSCIAAVAPRNHKKLHSMSTGPNSLSRLRPSKTYDEATNDSVAIFHLTRIAKMTSASVIGEEHSLSSEVAVADGIMESLWRTTARGEMHRVRSTRTAASVARRRSRTEISTNVVLLRHALPA